MEEFDLCDLCNELSDCNECKHINLTELEQISDKYIHYCYKYKKRLSHNAQELNRDNFILPCEECIMDDYEEFEEK